MPQKTDMPATFAVCLIDAEACPLSATCLHAQAATMLPPARSQTTDTIAVNLLNPDLHAGTTACQAFTPTTTRRFARGMSKIFYHVPKGIYKEVVDGVIKCFTNRRYYFHCKKGTLLITPKEQEAIAKVFQQNGVSTPPVFDEYIDAYDWE